MSSSSIQSNQVIAIIGGSGFYHFSDMCNLEQIRVDTPFGDVLGVEVGTLAKKKIVFIARHGSGHRLPPHKINYRANIWALHELNVKQIISLNAVGAINPSMQPSSMVIPDQLIDYTFGRDHTFAELLSSEINHIDFTEPFSGPMRDKLAEVLQDSGLDWHKGGVYACTQGPRLETAAEINRLERDGCDIVGMTVMPEAALARELKIDYVSLCTVANWAAGRGEDELSMADIQALLDKSKHVLRQILVALVAAL